MKHSYSVRPFGKLPDGREVFEYSLRTETGFELAALDYGAVVTRLLVPHSSGHAINVVLGHGDLTPYRTGRAYMGAVAGRYANRIAGGSFTLDDRSWQLDRNEGIHTLHGGAAGFSHRPWTCSSISTTDEEAAVEFRLDSEDGDGGFPGHLQVIVRYTLNRRGEWRVDYEATTSRPTVVNLTQHSYFNLAGEGSAMDHLLTVAASRYLPVDESLIPLMPADVEGTPFDFRTPCALSARMDSSHPQLKRARGYDHTWILDGDNAQALAFAARLQSPASGLTLDIFTTEPGIQVYTANDLQHRAVCLETQHFPDSPNRPDFPSTVLRPGERYRSRTLFRFSQSALG